MKSAGVRAKVSAARFSTVRGEAAAAGRGGLGEGGEAFGQSGWRGLGEGALRAGCGEKWGPTARAANGVGCGGQNATARRGNVQPRGRAEGGRSRPADAPPPSTLGPRKRPPQGPPFFKVTANCE